MPCTSFQRLFVDGVHQCRCQIQCGEDADRSLVFINHNQAVDSLQAHQPCCRDNAFRFRDCLNDGGHVRTNEFVVQALNFIWLVRIGSRKYLHFMLSGIPSNKVAGAQDTDALADRIHHGSPP